VAQEWRCTGIHLGTLSSTSTSLSYQTPKYASRKYAYADGLAIINADGDWLAVEGVLSKDDGSCK